MTGRTQGLLLGCTFLAVVGAAFTALMWVLFVGHWNAGDMSLLAENKVGLVVLEGPIGESRGLIQEIEENREDSSVKAVVLRIDSPGGEVAPSQEIHDAVARLAETKPVVASLGSVAASGGYYVAVAADSIVADPGSLTGSIGVIFSFPTVHDLMEKAGVKMQVFKSGELKDMGSFARDPTEKEEAVFDALVADVYDQFVTAVAQGRRLDRDRVLAMADGRVFTGRQAVELGLVDRLGDLDAAERLAARMAGLRGEPTVVRKARPRLPILEVVDRFLRQSARASWGPLLEYRFR